MIHDVLPKPGADAPVVMVTGANGFIGKELVAVLRKNNGYRVRRCSRMGGSHCDIAVGSIGRSTNWSEALDGVTCIVHLAGRAHVLNEVLEDPLDEFRRVNVDGTLSLARQAADAGVRRFVFLSSIGVNGNQSVIPFTESDIPRPAEYYALSKLEAEEGLREIADETGMELVMIRPPLVYGANAPGNFGRLLNAVWKRMPLPLGSIDNRRSLVSLPNLVDFVQVCMNHPAATNEIFLVADGEDLSTTELLQRLGDALGKPARLIAVPVWLLEAGAALVGKRAVAQRLCGSLQVDISKAREVLGWTPPVSVDEALRETARAFLEAERNG